MILILATDDTTDVDEQTEQFSPVIKTTYYINR